MPVFLVMGGSLGSQTLNTQIRSYLPKLLERFQVVHLCGKGNLDPHLTHQSGYRQFEYLHSEMPDILAMTDLVVSRAGANSICEFLALQIPSILIPLTLQQSRGDQILNAQSFEKAGYSRVLYEENLPQTNLSTYICETYDQRTTFLKNMGKNSNEESLQKLMKLITESGKNH